MKQNKPNLPAIDCVALKRRAQAKIHADIKDMSATEQITYFRRRARSGALGAWWERVSPLTTGTSPLAVREKPAKKYGS